MAKLFEHTSDAPPQRIDPSARVVGVAVNANVWRTFDYLWPAALGDPLVGQRVNVSFGRGDRKTGRRKLSHIHSKACNMRCSSFYS